MAAVPRLQTERLSKAFGGVQALRGADCRVMGGTIHALLGENGAGKSTLVKIVAGVQAADSGIVRIDGVLTAYPSPMAARAAGVTAVFQDPKLFPHLSVAENVFVGAEPLTRWGTLARERMRGKAQRLFDEMGADLDVRRPVLGLSVGEVQFVEFARAMAVGSIRLIFLDEPTAALSPVETERLFALVRRLKAEGAAIVFISHRLEEMEGFVDEVTILRDGADVLSARASELTSGAIVNAMVGRDLAQELDEEWHRNEADLGAALLEVDKLKVPHLVEDVAFAVRAGEVVGLAGLVGAGRTEAALAILGALPSSGTVRVEGAAVTARSPRKMKAMGVAYVPEDRDADGLVPSHAIDANLSLASLRELSGLGMLFGTRERSFVAQAVGALDIRLGRTSDPVASLSGGNRQKVVLGKWLARSPKIFILDEPTHGIDVGTKANIHRLIRQLAADGAAVLLISSDLPEIIALSDRILVMRAGRIVGEEPRGASQERVIALATGQRAEAPA